MITFGKVIGGGMPVGAFGGKKEIMACLSPEGPVYQAGTLSGNPIAMSAGIASLSEIIKREDELYPKFNTLSKRLMDGLKKIADENNIPLQVDYRGSMFGFFFTAVHVANFDDALTSDTTMFAKFHQEMLKRGVYLACSQFETGFICDGMSEDTIDEVLKIAKEVMKNL